MFVVVVVRARTKAQNINNKDDDDDDDSNLASRRRRLICWYLTWFLFSVGRRHRASRSTFDNEIRNLIFMRTLTNV
jgi:hypothetical protein